VLFGLVGIVFVSTNLDFSTLVKGQVIADFMLIVAGVAWALFMIYNKRMIIQSTSAMFQWMTWVLVFTMFTIAPFGVLAGEGLFVLSAWELAAIVYTAIVFAIFSDVLAATPTLRKAWRNPESEFSWPFVVGVFSPMTSFLVTQTWAFADIAFPAYLVFINILLVVSVSKKK
jgi:hypothetical protein